VLDDPDHLYVMGLLANFNLCLFRFSLMDGSVQTIADTNDIKQWRELVSFCLYKSRDGILWVGTLKGLFGFDPKSRKLLHSPQLDTELSKYQISCITEAEDGSLWIGTMGSGLFHYDHLAGRLNQYTTMEGLPNNKIAGVLIDGKNLWVSTYHGLAYFFHDRKSFVRFYKNDGLTHSEFNRRSSCKSSDGRFWFGSLDGINSFTTQDLFYSMTRQESKVLPVEISYSKNRKQSVEHFRFSELKSLHIPANRRYCSFRFAMSGYHSDILPQIAYRVEGIDHEWNYTDGNQFSISWLPSGRHTLKVKGADQAGNWSEEYHILLDVQEYFYKSWWFIGLLFALTGGAVWQFNRLRLRRHLEQLESNRLRELNEVKSKLYAYITHEFRTPLTLILGYASYGIENDSKESPHFQKIKSAGKRLLQLVNQILDLNKIESGSIEVHMIQDDLVFYLKELFEHFRELAERKKIHYRFDTSVSELQMDYDKDLVMKIISNLLSNAIKFTPEGGRVEMRLTYPVTDVKDPDQMNEVEILIRDNGPGLTEDQQRKIFDPFYQVSAQDALQGTGIGLALVKELTQLLDGEVMVSSTPGKGSEFALRLKRMQKAKPTAEHTSDPVPDWVTGNIREPGQMEDIYLSDSQTTGKKGVLIVEDNPEVAGFIMQGLGDHYQTRWAEHGKIGLEMARDWVPDLILSDVMMPEMDGLALLERLKADPVTSHIPVVLLTSLAEVEHKIAGLKRGANAYLAKPFEAEELRLTLNNLIRLSDQIRMRYSQAVDSRNFELPAVPEPESTAAPADHKTEQSQKSPVQLDLELEDAFFKKLVQYIEAHLTESEMDIQDLCRAVGMSQSQLNRKIHALTGVSSVKLVRAVRLSHACKLLKTRKDLQVSEIAYETGFTSPAYFTRVFTQEFGTAPSEWRDH
ncbi:MAG TPA: ATP-binding protein, partial [Saprospiraceae bacterium]|nr:ATP-binding protein [Saprospiraceae bacterium]